MPDHIPARVQALAAQINDEPLAWNERWLFPIIIIPAMLFAAIITTFFLIRAWRRNETVFE